MDLGLKSKVAVVTGASKGIGLAVTKALVAEGARVIAGARDVGSELRSLADSGAVDAVSIDLATPGGPQSLVAEAQKYGGLAVPGQRSFRQYHRSRLRHRRRADQDALRAHAADRRP